MLFAGFLSAFYCLTTKVLFLSTFTCKKKKREVAADVNPENINGKFFNSDL